MTGQLFENYYNYIITSFYSLIPQTHFLGWRLLIGDYKRSLCLWFPVNKRHPKEKGLEDETSFFQPFDKS